MTVNLRLSKYQFGFRKGLTAQHCCLPMLEKWKNVTDKGKVFGALLTDLSNYFQKPFIAHHMN